MTGRDGVEIGMASSCTPEHYMTEALFRGNLAVSINMMQVSGIPVVGRLVRPESIGSGSSTPDSAGWRSRGISGHHPLAPQSLYLRVVIVRRTAASRYPGTLESEVSCVESPLYPWVQKRT
jgi:hypothetical protein